MSIDSYFKVRANVIFKPPGSRSLGEVEITVATLPAVLPAQEDVDAARACFEQAGFDVGELAGISFSISADAGVFESFFGVRLTRRHDGRVAVRCTGEVDGLELPCDRLVPSIAAMIEAVVLTPTDKPIA